MPTFFGLTTHRIVYKAIGFTAGKTVTAYVWNPSLVKSVLQPLIEISDGIYYLDYAFPALGTYFGIFYENGVATISGVFRILTSLGAGAGAIMWTYTLTDFDTGAPIDGAEIWITTDSAGTNVIASGTTNAYGISTFYLDSGQIFVWRKRAGYNFVNPDSETVV